MQKKFSHEKLWSQPRFRNEVQSNSEMAYLVLTSTAIKPLNLREKEVLFT